jgi:general secretion pathway protein L
MAYKMKFNVGVSSLFQASARFMGEFCEWWYDGLVDALPSGFRARRRQHRAAFEATIVGGEIKVVPVSSNSHGANTRTFDLPSAKPAVIAPSDPGANGGAMTTVALRVPAEHVLVRTLTMPLAVEPELARAVTFEIDRETPFVPDATYFGFQVTARDALEKRLRIALYVVPRVTVARLCETLNAGGFTVTDLILEDSHASITVAGPQPAVRRHMNPRILLRAAVVVALAIGVIATPLMMQQHVISRLTSDIVALKPALIAVRATGDAMRRDQDRIATIYRWLNERLTVTGLLDLLNTTLPPTAWLTEISLQSGVLVMTGESTAPQATAHALNAEPRLKDLAYRETPANTGESTRFQVTATTGRRAE